MRNRTAMLGTLGITLGLLACRSSAGTEAAVPSGATEAAEPTAAAGGPAASAPVEASAPVVASGGPAEPEASVPAEASAADVRADALRRLRAALDQVRSAPPSAEPVVVPGGDAEPLVGLTREVIRAALGEPSTCERDVSFDARGVGHPVAPCRGHGDWFYSFYRLPENWVGGGPELLLQFDVEDRCTAALWRHTQ